MSRELADLREEMAERLLNLSGASRRLSTSDLAQLFGGTEQEVKVAGGDILNQADFSYRVPMGIERDDILLDILKRLESRRTLPTAGESRQDDWERGWTENLNDLLVQNFDISALAPKYLRPGEPVRLLQQLAIPLAPNFVRDYTMLFRNWVFRRYLSDASAVYEFGCGPGAHIAYLAETFPKMRLFGLDWAEASVKILDALATRFDWPIHGRRFDFFNPDKTLQLEPGAAVVTFGALEQTGNRFGAFLDFLLKCKPTLCLHVEPLAELYDEKNLIDHLSLRYHQQRGYLDGFLTRLYQLQSEGKITIERVHRHYLGTKFAETYSYVVWRPTH